MNLKNDLHLQKQHQQQLIQYPHTARDISHQTANSKHTAVPDSISLSPLLLVCARKDKGGGVGFVNNNKNKPNETTFAIYSTAILPPSWQDTLLYTTREEDRVYVQRLEDLARKISEILPIYTSWDDFTRTSTDTQADDDGSVKSLPASPTLLKQSPSETVPLAQRKPCFLMNAALHKSHCIIGQGSVTETLLVVLRRPWCVLEICVGSVDDDHDDGSDDDDADIIKQILAFAKLAQQKDESGYSTAVFLLEYELEKKKKRHTSTPLSHGCSHSSHSSHAIISSRQQSEKNKSLTALSSTNQHPYKWPNGSYETCNQAVFLSSLESFNSFWICLICVCAVETGVSFSSVVDGLAGCGGGGGSNIPKNDAQQGLHISRRYTIFSERKRRRRRRKSDGVLDLEENRRDDNGFGNDYLVKDMLQLYMEVLRRTRGCV